MTNGGRITAWKDSLTTEEKAVADRIIDLPLEMRGAYVYVHLARRQDALLASIMAKLTS